METLKTANFNENKIVLSNNLVQSDILPNVSKELGRDISVEGQTLIKGAVYARNFYISAGPLTVEGAVFAQGEIHVKADTKGLIHFHKAVGSANSIVCLLTGEKAVFYGDVTAKKVSLRNCFVSGSVMADEIDLENCCILGGAFASKTLNCKNVVIGTFNAPEVLLSGRVFMLMPSAYSIEPITAGTNLELWNLTTADLAALYFEKEQNSNTGKIPMDLKPDTVEIQLTDNAGNKNTVRSLSVAGKIMMADLIEMDQLRNHFILKAGSLAGHLSKTFNLEEGELQPLQVSNLFFNILSGSVEVRDMNKTVTLEDLKQLYS